MASDLSKWAKKTFGLPEINLRKKVEAIPFLADALKKREMDIVQKAVDALDEATFNVLQEAVANRLSDQIIKGEING